MRAMPTTGARSYGITFRPEATSRVMYCSRGINNTVARMKKVVHRTLTGANSSVPRALPPYTWNR